MNQNTRQPRDGGISLGCSPDGGEKMHRGYKMTQLAERSTYVLTRGRQKKFTPERIQQIKNLVGQGTSRERIADLIGVTVGSLQVTCSRLGVSLRRPNVNNGTGLLGRNGARSNGIVVPLEPAKERPEEESRRPVKQAELRRAMSRRRNSGQKEQMKRPPQTSPSECSTEARSEHLNCRSLRKWSDNSRLRQSSGTCGLGSWSASSL